MDRLTSGYKELRLDNPATIMVDPKNFREVAIDLAAFKREIDPQFKFLNQMILMIGTVLIAIVGGGIAIWVQIGDLKATASATARDVAALNERTSRLEKLGGDILASNKDASATLSRIESRLASTPPPDLGPYAPLNLSPDEQKIIRELVGIKGPVPTTDSTRWTIGDVVPESAAVKPLPSALVEKVPKLRGAKYSYDAGSVIIVGAGNRVVAIIATV